MAIRSLVLPRARKTASDEMDAKKWNSRITVALVSCIGAVLASVIVNLLVVYYQLIMPTTYMSQQPNYYRKFLAIPIDKLYYSNRA